MKPNCPRSDNSKAWVKRAPIVQAPVKPLVAENPWNRLLQAHAAEEEKKQDPPAPIKNTLKTLIVRNLPRNIGDGELHAIYSRYGNVTDIYIPMNKDKTNPYYGTIKGFALIKYANADDALKGYIAEGTMIKREIRGKKLVTEFAKEDR
jgi:RNA recognition motif-containing protein